MSELSAAQLARLDQLRAQADRDLDEVVARHRDNLRRKAAPEEVELSLLAADGVLYLTHEAAACLLACAVRRLARLGKHAAEDDSNAVDWDSAKLDVAPVIAHWRPAPPAEALLKVAASLDLTYPGLRDALAEHEPHGPSCTVVQDSGLGFRAARCTVCDREIWNISTKGSTSE